MNEATMGQAQGQEQPVVINYGDLSTVLQLIDVVSTRGGFQGNELAGVGLLRNKLEAYLRQNAPQQLQGAEQAAEQEVQVEEVPAGELADKLVD